MKKASKNKQKFYQKNQPLLVAAAFAVLGVSALGISKAQHGSGSGNAGNASIGGASECLNGVWTVHASVIANVAVLIPVDIYETSDNVGHVKKIQNRLILSNTVPRTFNTTPTRGVTDDVLYVVEGDTSPLGTTTTAFTQPIAESATMFDACNPPAPSGKNRVH